MLITNLSHGFIGVIIQLLRVGVGNPLEKITHTVLAKKIKKKSAFKEHKRGVILGGSYIKCCSKVR